jgi:hypothetical protein
MENYYHTGGSWKVGSNEDKCLRFTSEYWQIPAAEQSKIREQTLLGREFLGIGLMLLRTGTFIKQLGIQLDIEIVR